MSRLLERVQAAQHRRTLRLCRRRRLRRSAALAARAALAALAALAAHRRASICAHLAQVWHRLGFPRPFERFA